MTNGYSESGQEGKTFFFKNKMPEVAKYPKVWVV
jgi:hypothetical protein